MRQSVNTPYENLWCSWITATPHRHWPDSGARGKVRGSPKLSQFIFKTNDGPPVNRCWSRLIIMFTLSCPQFIAFAIALSLRGVQLMQQGAQQRCDYLELSSVPTDTAGLDTCTRSFQKRCHQLWVVYVNERRCSIASQTTNRGSCELTGKSPREEVYKRHGAKFRRNTAFSTKK